MEHITEHVLIDWLVYRLFCIQIIIIFPLLNSFENHDKRYKH